MSQAVPLGYIRSSARITPAGDRAANAAYTMRWLGSERVARRRLCAQTDSTPKASSVVTG